MTALRWGSATDVGRVRQNNEDNLVVASPLFAVADGMGGHAAGEVASQIAVNRLEAAFAEHATIDGLVDAVRAANRAVYDQGRDQPDHRGMGTTLTAAALVEVDGDEQLAVVNVGDSRGYLLRDGELSQITEDHSLVEEMVRSGQLSAEEAQVHPRRNVVTRVLGIEPDVDVDVFPVVPFRGDRILLASDGLFNEVTDAQIASTLRRLADADEAARELVKLARDHGGNDNITVIVIDVVDDDDRAIAASSALAGEPRAARTTTKRPLLGQGDSATGGATAAAEPTPSIAIGPTRSRITGRAVLFTLAVVLVLAGAVVAIGVYARASYYVGPRGAVVAIYKGRPGGLLWFEPTLHERTSLPIADVPPVNRADVAAGKEEASLAAARTYVANLQSAAAKLRDAGAAAPAPVPVPVPPPTAP